MPSTIVHGLLPAACVLSSQSALPALTKKEKIRLFVVSCFLANFPDLDVIPASLVGNAWGGIHRNWGHNIFSVSFGIWLGSYLIRKYVSPQFSKKLSWILSFLLVGSHLLFDSMQGANTEGVFVGIPFFFPFSAWEFRLPLKVFKAVTISHQTHFLTGYLTSMAFWKDIIYWEFLYIAGFWLTWNIVFTTGSYFVKQSKRKKQIEESILAFRNEQQSDKSRAA